MYSGNERFEDKEEVDGGFATGPGLHHIEQFEKEKKEKKDKRTRKFRVEQSDDYKHWKRHG